MPKKKVVVPADTRQEVIQGSDTWEHDGIVYSRGDAILIKGERGKFTFKGYEINTKTGKDWVWCWWEGYYNRAFHTDRVKAPKRKSQRGRGRGAGNLPDKERPAPLCPVHRRYMAIRRPRTDCGPCWRAYEESNKEKANG